MTGGSAVILLAIVAVLSLFLALTFAILWWKRRLAQFHSEIRRFKAAAQIAERSRQSADARAVFLGEILDALPTPVWRRADDLELVYVNKAYAAAVGAESPAAALLDNVEIGGRDAVNLARRARRTNALLSESRTIVVGEKRQLIEITERPLNSQMDGETANEVGGGLIGEARDVTALAEAQDGQARLVAAHAEVLERVGSAVAVFTGARQLAFCNSAFVTLFGLDPARIEQRIGLSELLDDLRQLRMLPEVVDFAAFKAGRAHEFQSLVTPREEFLFLPNGRTLKETAAPHPQGGVIYVYEDVSDHIALERSYHTLNRVQRQTLDALQDGVALFGEDGRLRLSNRAFDEIFRISDDGLDAASHVSALADAAGTLLTEETWASGREGLINAVTGRVPAKFRVNSIAGRTLDIETAPLADGGVLTALNDITDSYAVETALRGRADALEEADRLKNEFLYVISYELRTPLTTIIGFADMLRAGRAGDLTVRQAEYLDDIMSACGAFIALVDDIIDVAAIEAGRAPLERAPASVAAAIEAATLDAADRIAPQPLNVTPTVAPGLTLDADAGRLKQILTRLIMVAGRYARDGDAIVVTAVGEGEWAMISVTTGKAAAISGSIAKPPITPLASSETEDVPPARTARASLDLTLAARLAEAHGGEVVVTSAAPGALAAYCRMPRLPDAE